MKYKDLLLKLADIVEQNLVCGNSMDKYVLQDKYEIRNEWQQEFVRNLPNEVMKNCIREYERCKSYIGHIKVNQLQPTYIQKMVNELFKKGYKRATVKQSVSV